MSIIVPNITPKIVIDGYTSNEPFVKFTQLYEWNNSNNFCLSVENGYTNLNKVIIDGNNNTSNIYMSSLNSNMIFGIRGNTANYIFRNSNNELLRITNSSVGIGITNPNYKLDVNGNINSLLLYKNNIELDDIYLKIINNYWIANNNNIYVNLASNISNVGIGNSNPLGTLHLGTTTSNSDATIVISKYNNSSIIRNFKLGYDANFNFIMGDFGDATTQVWKSQFYINSNAPIDSLVILSNGNIGIGTNISTNKLTVSGSVSASAFIGVGSNITNLNYNNITQNAPNLSNLNNWIYSNLSAGNGAILYNNNVRTIAIGKTSANTNFLLDVNGNIKCRGTLNVNSSTLSVGSGGGVTLQLNDGANAGWQLTTGGYEFGFNNNNGGSYSRKMTLSNTGNLTYLPKYSIYGGSKAPREDYRDFVICYLEVRHVFHMFDYT
jgi:hypothetical protein